LDVIWTNRDSQL